MNLSCSACANTGAVRCSEGLGGGPTQARMNVPADAHPEAVVEPLRRGASVDGLNDESLIWMALEAELKPVPIPSLPDDACLNDACSGEGSHRLEALVPGVLTGDLAGVTGHELEEFSANCALYAELAVVRDDDDEVGSGSMT